MSTIKCSIRLESFDSAHIKNAISNIRDLSAQMDIKLGNKVSLPTKKKIYTVLRSPHIDKKSREQFEIRNHISLIEIYHNNQKIVENFLMKIKESLLPGVSLKIKFYFVSNICS